MLVSEVDAELERREEVDVAVPSRNRRRGWSCISARVGREVGSGGISWRRGGRDEEVEREIKGVAEEFGPRSSMPTKVEGAWGLDVRIDYEE